MEVSGEWRLIREEARSGPMNMALDEIAAATAAEDGLRTVRVYAWEPSTFSLGYTQADDTVDWAFCEREGIPVTRRPTGGGGIYHDRYGDISYSIVVTASDVPGDLMASYHLLLEPILDAFDRLGLTATLADQPQPSLYEPACYLRAVNPAHDVVVDGRKLSGNAQHRTRDAVVQHGSITYARDPERHLDVFANPEVTPQAFQARVTSLRELTGADRERAVSVLETALAAWSGADVDSWSEDELEAARELAAAQFDDDGWTRRH